MGQRKDYEHLELDTDNNYYYFMNRDIEHATEKNLPELAEIIRYFHEHEENKGLYWKGTRLYFTFKGKKWYLTWTFRHDDLIQETANKLKSAGADNIQINWGELD